MGDWEQLPDHDGAETPVFGRSKVDAMRQHIRAREAERPGVIAYLEEVIGFYPQEEFSIARDILKACVVDIHKGVHLQGPMYPDATADKQDSEPDGSEGE